MNQLSLNNQILLGAITGALFGLWFAQLGQDSAISQNGLYAAKLAGTLFTDLLKMVLIPLVFTSIVVGVANLRAHQQMNRVWQVTLIFFMSTMALAVALGLAAANLFQPGRELPIAMFQDAMQNFQATQMSLPEFFAHFLHSLFQNPVAALAQGNVLAVVIFALLLGIDFHHARFEADAHRNPAVLEHFEAVVAGEIGRIGHAADVARLGGPDEVVHLTGGHVMILESAVLGRTPGE